MGRWCLGLAVLAVLSGGDEDALSAREPRASSSVIGPEPDVRRASPVGLCPDDADLERLRSVEGQPQGVVLRTLGHPRRVVRRADGSAVWHYPWLATCEVYIKREKCIGIFYCGGY